MKIGEDQRGSATLVATVSLLTVLLIAAIGFGAWAFMGRQDYKTNVDGYVKEAVEKNTKTVRAQDAAKFAEEAKNPLKTYVGPVEFGAVTLQYPKTWSAYVMTGSSGGQPLNAYFHPDVVPAVQDQNSTFGLRVEVITTTYSQVLQSFSSFQRQGKATFTPYALPKVPGVVGTRIDGQLSSTKKGTVVVIPMRDKTLKIYTESEAFLPDLNNIILPNASFSP